MWTTEQRQRLYLEHQALIREGLDQFGVYRDSTYDSYWAAGTATANSGRQYRLYIPISSGYPYQRPEMYLTEPNPLRMYNGSPVASLGVSHNMHTLTPHANGWPQICHWRSERWHSGIMLHRVFLKGLIWVEAFEQHLATGLPIADFVRTMTETA